MSATPITIDIHRLQQLSATSVQLTYNTDSADTLMLTLRPEDYAKLPLEARQRLTVTDGDRVVFSGIVPAGANCAAEAAAGETVEVELQSDCYVLTNTVYAKIDMFGRPMYARKVAEGSTTTVAKVVQGIETWLGAYLPSRLSCDVSATVPTPTANGTAPCSSVLNDCLKWVPDCVLVQRYGATNTLTVTTPEKLGEPLVFSPATHPLQSVSLKPRHDLQVPVCALIGGVHAVYPQGGDIRELGAFVYAVPFDKTDENQSGGAGGSPASQKMVVKGVQLPENRVFAASKDEYKMNDFSADSYTAKFIKAMLPEYVPFIPYLRVGSILVNVMGEDTLAEDTADDKDEDTKTPANYRGDSSYWEKLIRSVYVHTEGSFTASHSSQKNVKGLHWCKASLGLVLAIRMAPESEVPRELWEVAEELFPGRRKSTYDDKPARYAYVRKTFNVNLIDKRKKVYDPATNKLCSTDTDYEPENENEAEDTPTALDYKAAMKHYYDVASQLQHEGSINLLYDGSLNPAELTGRRVLVNGLRPEWEDMNAIVRSVSWNYEQRKLSLSLGTRAVMGFEEYLERRLLARNRGRDKSQEEALAYDTRDTEAQDEAESDMSISPNIASNTDTTSTGRWVKPFTLYVKEGETTVWLKGGVLRKGDFTVEVEDTDKQIKNGEKGDKDWTRGEKVKLKWKTRPDKTITYDIYQS